MIDSVFIDAYAGTGAVGIEALSRGARHVIFVERSRAAVNVLRENLSLLDVKSRAVVYEKKSAAILKNSTADIIFLDPPYELELEYETVLPLTQAALVVAQHSIHLGLRQHYGRLSRVRQIKQGDNCLSFFGPAEPA